MHTLDEVFDQQDMFCDALHTKSNAGGQPPLFEKVYMDGMLIMGDRFLRDLFSMYYGTNVNIVPHGVPAVGPIRSAYILYRGKKYLALSQELLARGQYTWHCFRQREELYMQWETICKDKTRELFKILREMKVLSERYCPSLVPSWDEVLAIIDYEDTDEFLPTSFLFEVMSDALAQLSCYAVATARDLERTVRRFSDQVRPYIGIGDHLLKYNSSGIQQFSPNYDHNRKLFVLSEVQTLPSLVNMPLPSDKLIDALPSRRLIQQVIGLMEFYKGILPGHSLVLLPPFHNFFSEAQKLVDENARLGEVWETLRNSEPSMEGMAKWWQETVELFNDLGIKILPDILANRVVGIDVFFQVETNSAHIRPIVSNAHFLKSKIRMKNQINFPLQGVLLGI